MSRRRRILITLAAVPLLLALALAWLLGTTAGLRFALARAGQATGGALSVHEASGRLAGTVTLDGLRFHASGGPDVRAKQVQADLAPWALLRGRVQLHSLRVRSLDVDLPTPAPATPAHSTPFDPRAPVDLVFDRVQVDGLRVHRADADLFVAARVDLAGAWTRDGVELSPLRVRAPDGSIDADARLAFTAGHPGNAKVRFDWKAAGRRWQGHLQARGNGRRATASIVLVRPSPAHADLTLSTRSPYAWTAKVTLPRGAAAPWLGAGQGIKQLAAALDAHGDAHQLHATGSLDLDATRLQLAALDARLADGGKQVHLEHLTLRSPQQPGTLDASGRIDLAATPTAELHVDWKNVTLPADRVGRALATHGTLDVDGSLDDYRVTLDAVAGTPGQSATLKARARGTPGQVQVEQLTVQQAKGRLEARGSLRYGARLAWQLTARAHAFDPGMLLAGWKGALDASLSIQGSLGKPGPEARLEIDTLTGRLRGHKVDGHGSLALSPQHVLAGRLDLRVGDSHLALAGGKGARNDLRANLHIGALGAWADGAKGVVTARLHARGTWPRLALEGELDGSGLDWHGQRAGQLSARFDLPDVRTPGGTVHLTARDLHAGGFRFKALQLDAHGNARAHSLTAQASGDPLSLRLALEGGMQGRAWHGRLTRLDLSLADQPDWHLQAPVALAWDNGTTSLGQACLSAGQPRLCVAAERQRSGALQASYRMRQLPLELPLALAGNDLPMRASGSLDGDGQVKRPAGGALTGQATITSARGSVSYLDHPQEPLLDYRQLKARLDLSPSGQTLGVTAALQHSGTLDARVRVGGPRHALDGRVRMHLDNLHFVELFTTAVANLKGQLDADLALAGTLDAPSVRGSASVDDLAGELPALGLKLTQGRVRLSGDQNAALHIDGQVHSGKGTLKVTGSVGLGAGQTTRLAVSGQQVEVANIPSASVSLSPDVRVEGDARGLAIDGQVGVDRADVNLEKLPGSGATQASPDVVVVDASQPPPARGATLPLTTDVKVELGDHAHVTGYGLDGNLHGSLRVSARPGKQAQGQGQIRIDGTFRAYGQNLTITRGRLLFASSPLDNPGLDMRAVRKLNPNATVDDGQEVGLEVRGTARHPQLTVFSNPAMEQSDALSYLITGKPLSQVKGGEGSTVDAAAQALGSATGDLLAKSVGSRLGISDIGVSSNDALGTTAFTVGKYLSPRLYLSYGVGLFEPGQVVTLRYILSRRWNFEAQQSTNASRASFNYRYEH